MIRTRFLIATLSSLVLAGTVFAQPKLPGRRNIKQMVERAVKSQKVQLTQQMDQRVDELDRVCKLEAKQRKRLTIAAKGAVGKSLDYYAKYIESVYTRQFNRNAFRIRNLAVQKRANATKKKAQAKKAKGKAKKEKGKKVQAKKKEIARRIARPAMRIIPYKRPIPWQEKIWLVTVKKTLNETQTVTYNNHLRARRAFNRRNGVGVFVSQMDQQLLLTNDQRVALEELVDQHFGKAMENTAANQIYALQGWVGMDARGRRRTQRLPQEKLRAILSPAQYESWTKQARRFGGFGGLGFRAIAADAGVAAAAARPAKKAVKKKPAKKVKKKGGAKKRRTTRRKK